MNTELYKKIEQKKVRGAWDKGVKEYALELVDGAEVELTRDNVKQELLNGASDWSEYSYSGNSLIYDYEIAERLCSPSQLKKTKGGELSPNSREEWLDVQARALRQALSMIRNKL